MKAFIIQQKTLKKAGVFFVCSLINFINQFFWTTERLYSHRKNVIKIDDIQRLPFRAKTRCESFVRNYRNVAKKSATRLDDTVNNFLRDMQKLKEKPHNCTCS